MRSYPEFIKYFKNVQLFDIHHLIIGSHFIYGWMPTILNLNINENNENLLYSYLFEAKNGVLLKPVELATLKECINNSLVGTSKLLHFINPKVYAIWDSKIYKYFYPNKKSTYGIDQPSIYLDYLAELKEITNNKEFQNLLFKIESYFDLDYQITPFRAVELLIFEIQKNKGI